MTTPLVEVKNLSKRYGNNLALNRINLTLQPGNIIGLLGPNGSGKTTLIKILTGLLQPTEGEVLIKGQVPSPETKEIVSYLPDTTYLDENMKVMEALDLFKTFYADFDTKTALKLLQDLNISLDTRMKKLSKGTKEKVQLVLVMSRRARLYVLDEPIGGVDPAAREYILRTIINNYSPQASVLISTHLITDIENILDKFIFINKGQIVRQGDVDDVRSTHGESVDELFRDDFRL